MDPLAGGVSDFYFYFGSLWQYHSLSCFSSQKHEEETEQRFIPSSQGGVYVAKVLQLFLIMILILLTATYRGSYSWFEAVIIRPIPPKNSSQPDTVTNNEDIYTTTTEDKPDNHNHTHNSDSESLKITTPSPRFPDPASLEAHYLEPRGYQLVPRVHCSKERKRKKKDEEVYKSWTVQHNLVAVAQAREHEVEWWDDDTDDDDNNNGDEAENDKDDETGKGSGRGFVKALRPGDKVGVLVRAMVSDFFSLSLFFF